MKRFFLIRLNWDEEDGVAKFGTIEMATRTSSGDRRMFRKPLKDWLGKPSMPVDLISVQWICSQIDKGVATFLKSIQHRESKAPGKE